MYFATDISSQFKDVYIMMLDSIINEENHNYNGIIKIIIDESKQLAESKDFYQVSNERFEIVSLFAQNTDLLNEVDSDNLSSKDFIRLRDYLMNVSPIA